MCSPYLAVPRRAPKFFSPADGSLPFLLPYANRANFPGVYPTISLKQRLKWD